MRIISKFPDYYDFVCKVYDPAGEDPVVWDRRTHSGSTCFSESRTDLTELFSNRLDAFPSIYAIERFLKSSLDYTGILSASTIYFAFAGSLYPVINIWLDRKTTWINSVDEFLDLVGLDEMPELSDWTMNGDVVSEGFFDPIELPEKFHTLAFASEAYRCRYFRDTLTFEYVSHEIGMPDNGYKRLIDYGMNSRFSPHEAYGMIDQYVSCILNIEKDYNASNDERIVSKGFDKKSSFRPGMKS